ncbi:MAG TPA: type II toxin-antitoxin system prevent-host-death family antitoxin [Blastocatellia bacterium]|nr:type II toxin-antitoxin system prevent-host-death family antitoxin [Blastocatellia bacterium]
MKSINVAELTNRLSLYLDEVRAGEEIEVRDRNEPIARIIPLKRVNHQDEELLALAAQGKVRLGGGVLDEAFWKLSAPRVPAEVLRRIISQERDED